jgi:hypothetical protein
LRLTPPEAFPPQSRLKAWWSGYLERLVVCVPLLVLEVLIVALFTAPTVAWK